MLLESDKMSIIQIAKPNKTTLITDYTAHATDHALGHAISMAYTNITGVTLMARGHGGGGGYGGGANINNLMKQAQKMQKDMARIQEELAEKTVDATAGGGAVKVVASCDKKIVELILEPEVVDPSDIEMLQDLVVAAVNEALRKAEEMSTAEMSKATGGFGGGMPGLF